MSDTAPRVPLVDLGAQYARIEDEVWAAVERVIESQTFINGPETTAFEAAFAAACEADQSIAVSSGTTALELALRALGVGPGDEVITVSHTFFATISAICSTGATPVLVDVDPDSWTMDPVEVEGALSESTRAIVPVHIYGHPADVPAINAVAPSIPIVEDAAQAHLARYRGSPIGSCAAAACYSFYPGKNLGAYGDAGAVTTSDPELAARIRALRDHGRASGQKYRHDMLGTNARASELQMAILGAKLPHLASWTADRQRLAQLYEHELADTGLEVQTVKPWAEHARHLFVLLHAQRDVMLDTLRTNGIGAGVHYPLACHQQPALDRRWRGTAGGLEITERIAATCLSLPLYPELTTEDAERIAGQVRASLPSPAAV